MQSSSGLQRNQLGRIIRVSDSKMIHYSQNALSSKL